MIFTDLDTAVREHPDLVRQYFMTEAVPAEYDKFAALNAALWSGGTFLYVPQECRRGAPFTCAVYADRRREPALFTHTLIVVEEGARGQLISRSTLRRASSGSRSMPVWSRCSSSRARISRS